MQKKSEQYYFLYYIILLFILYYIILLFHYCNFLLFFSFSLTTKVNSKKCKKAKYSLLFLSGKRSNFNCMNGVRVFTVIDSEKHCEFTPSSAFVS